MENPSYIALSHQMALRRQMDMIANNIANVSTPSYKAERILFSELVASPPVIANVRGHGTRLSFVEEAGALRDLRPGAMIQTDNKLDIAIHGSGYFVVETPAGPRYTRLGNFQLDQNGRISTPNGHLLLDQANQPMTVPPGDTRIEITPQGTITSDSGEIGRIRLVTFENERLLRRIGDGLYEAEMEPIAADPRTEVHQGMLEGSNVQAVAEITNMIEVLRRYQSAQRVLETEHELRRRAVEKIARVG